jgi:hypothetical protein
VDAIAIERTVYVVAIALERTALAMGRTWTRKNNVGSITGDGLLERDQPFLFQGSDILKTRINIKG